MKTFVVGYIDFLEDNNLELRKINANDEMEAVKIFFGDNWEFPEDATLEDIERINCNTVSINVIEV